VHITKNVFKRIEGFDLHVYRISLREITMRVYRKVPVLLITLAAAMLGACASVGPPVLERAVLGYDETDTQLSQKLLLLNIARWRAGVLGRLST